MGDLIIGLRRREQRLLRVGFDIDAHNSRSSAAATRSAEWRRSSTSRIPARRRVRRRARRAAAGDAELAEASRAGAQFVDHQLEP